jgi:molecular chaperone GrpE (heat shock protein)
MVPLFPEAEESAPDDRYEPFAEDFGAADPVPDETDEAVEVDSARPAAPAAPAADAWRPRFEARLDQVLETVSAFEELTRRQTEMIDRLHGENERLRRGELDRMLDPLLRDLIALADTCTRNARAWRARSDASPDSTAEALTGVVDDLGLVLLRQGVDVFQPEPGIAFNRREHRALRVELTADRDRDGSLVETVRAGYRQGSRIIRYADVAVWKYDPAAEPAEPLGDPAP